MSIRVDVLRLQGQAGAATSGAAADKPPRQRRDRSDRKRKNGRPDSNAVSGNISEAHEQQPQKRARKAGVEKPQHAQPAARAGTAPRAQPLVQEVQKKGQKGPVEKPGRARHAATGNPEARPQQQRRPDQAKLQLPAASAKPGKQQVCLCWLCI